jgi:AraC-like DNA-binding protein
VACTTLAHQPSEASGKVLGWTCSEGLIIEVDRQYAIGRPVSITPEYQPINITGRNAIAAVNSLDFRRSKGQWLRFRYVPTDTVPSRVCPGWYERQPTGLPYLIIQITDSASGRYPLRMTFYQQQLQQIQAAVYPHAYQREQVLRARRFIDERYAEPIALAEVAAAAGCSKFHFIRRFRQYYGRTPHQYLTSVRLIRARQLLRAGASVSAACYAVGFDSLPSFSALFRKTTGISPSTFAARCR